MSKHDDRRVVYCPECQTVIFSENVNRHFRKVHRRDLSGAEIVKILADASKRPVTPSDASEFLERVYRGEENRPQIERTPSSMRGWDAIREEIPRRSGPLGPSKG